MTKIEKLKLSNLESKFQKLTERDLNFFAGGVVATGGSSCTQTGSSCGCDGTCVCSCGTSVIIKPIIPDWNFNPIIKPVDPIIKPGIYNKV